MASLPTLLQIAGNHSTVYEAYYQQVDPAGINHVGALDAAAFLKRSGLPDGVLSKIWDLADAGGKGFLDKRGFFVALKLVALVQSGRPPSTAQLGVPAPPPCMVQADQVRGGSADWSIKPLEHSKYVEMFNSLGPIAGKLPGSKVKPVMLNSKLPVDVLGKIWDLSDVDQDGALDEEEFIVAMHLVYKALDNCPIPSVLPAELVPRSKQSGRPLVAGLPPDFSTDTLGTRRRPSTPSSVGALDVALHNALNKPASWVVSAAEKAKFDQLFVTLDTDMDGLVTGPDVKGVFLKTGLPQADLAQIWNLCDTKQNGSLTGEQFALAMHLCSERMRGSPVPLALTPDMMPPSLRPKAQATAPPLDSNVPLGLDVLSSSTPPPTSAPSSGNKELDQITEEMKTLQMDKATLEQEIIQGEADLKTKNCELRNLETEMEAVSAMLRQLDSQKKEAQKRLAELSVQKAALDRDLTETRQELEEEKQKVSMLKQQLEEQTKLLEEQEKELEQKRAELKGLCQEECGLQAEIDSKKALLLSLGQTQQDTQLQISQVKAKQVALEEQHVQLKTWVSQVDRALQAGDPGLVPESLLRDDQFLAGLPEPEYQQLSNTDGSSHSSFVSVPEEEIKDDPFKSKDPFSDMNGFMGDPFAGEDPFKAADPFKSGAVDDPFAGDPFKSAFGSEPKEGDYFAAGFEAASSTGGEGPGGGASVVPPPATPSHSVTSCLSHSVIAVKDPFDPFGLGKPATEETNVTADADPFGTDPFAPAGTAAPRPESPTPALPPKKGKNPPPRPAPPKHLAGSGGPAPPTGPTRAAPAPPLPDDPFASTGGGSAAESFANFADFGDC